MEFVFWFVLVGACTQPAFPACKENCRLIMISRYTQIYYRYEDFYLNIKITEELIEDWLQHGVFSCETFFKDGSGNLISSYYHRRLNTQIHAFSYLFIPTSVMKVKSEVAVVFI